MTRTPLDLESQRELILRLRLPLDHLVSHGDRRCGSCDTALVTILQLNRRNPRSLFSTKVIHNIGKKRLARLLRIVEPADEAARARVRAALPIRPEASRRA